jgi:hypothetical protein
MVAKNERTIFLALCLHCLIDFFVGNRDFNVALMDWEWGQDIHSVMDSRVSTYMKIIKISNRKWM